MSKNQKNLPSLPCFAVGDSVQLKAGGPVMSVSYVPTIASGTYGCQWFAGRKLESGSFHGAQLESAKVPDAIPTPTAEKKQ